MVSQIEQLNGRMGQQTTNQIDAQQDHIVRITRWTSLER